MERVKDGNGRDIASWLQNILLFITHQPLLPSLPPLPPPNPSKQWEKSHKRGFKCLFERGILSLYFNFKRARYRR